MPYFEASMTIANNVGTPFSVDPRQDVVCVFDPQNGVDLGDLPVARPNERWIERHEALIADFDQQMVVIGKSEDETSVIGREGLAFINRYTVELWCDDC